MHIVSNDILPVACFTLLKVRQTKERQYMNEYLLDPNVCTSSLGEDDTPITPGETAHKWYKDTDARTGKDIIVCSECGTIKEDELCEVCKKEPKAYLLRVCNWCMDKFQSES